MARPLVGISPSSFDSEHNTYRLTQNYMQCVYEVGGEPVMLSFDFASPERLDAVIFSGGGDIGGNSRIYDRPELTQGVNPARDRMEFALFKSVHGLGLPILGICRGHQLINVAMGGTLICDLPAAGYTENHRLDEGLCHPVICEPGSLAEDIFSARAASGIWSSHHQGVDKPGAGFRITARSPEGVVEAIEHENGRMFGLQTHPEYMRLLRPFELLLFFSKEK